MNEQKTVKQSPKKTLLIVTASILAFVLISLASTAVIINLITKTPDAGSIDSFKGEYGSAEMTTNGNLRTFGDPNWEQGFIFFGKDFVSADAYIPLLSAIAGKGIFAVQVMPGIGVSGLAANEAQNAVAYYPNVKEWFVGGHASGALTANGCMLRNPSDYSGLVLIASHADTDLTHLDKKALAIFGTEDKIMNMTTYEQSKNLLPKEGFIEYKVKGGNHSFFGMYGLEEGDGTATIANSRQVLIGAEIIGKFIFGRLT
jgi:hypothetical protein